MIKMKAGGIVLGGIAAYLILSKGIGAVERGIRNICVAHEWKNYYKYGKEGNMVPPGYAMHTRKNENGDNIDTGTVEAMKKQENSASNKGVGAKVTEVIAKAISDTFAAVNAEKEASEGEETASESEEKCPQDCDHCEAAKCPFEHLKNGGKIVEWNEKGEPVAGRYPWTDGEELSWKVSGLGVKSVEPNYESKNDEDISVLDFSRNPDGEFVEAKKETENEADSD